MPKKNKDQRRNTHKTTTTTKNLKALVPGMGQTQPGVTLQKHGCALAENMSLP